MNSILLKKLIKMLQIPAGVYPRVGGDGNDKKRVSGNPVKQNYKNKKNKD